MLFQFKTKPEDFIVKEELWFKPSGKWDVFFVRFQKKEINTMDIVQHLCYWMRLERKELGIAGLKDKNWITEQRISIYKKVLNRIWWEQKFLEVLGQKATILETARHNEPLAVWKNAGNYFKIRLEAKKEITPEIKEKIESNIQKILKNWFPNCFGKQRFGKGYRNFYRAKDIFEQASLIKGGAECNEAVGFNSLLDKIPPTALKEWELPNASLINGGRDPDLSGEQERFNYIHCIPYNPSLISKAKDLRKNMTKAEKKLRYDFLKNLDIKVLRQQPINEFIVDFYIASKKLVIEIDWETHRSDAEIEYDKKRTKVLESLWLQVIRFTNDEVYKNFEWVCNEINTSLNIIPPTPLNKGGHSKNDDFEIRFKLQAYASMYFNEYTIKRRQKGQIFLWWDIMVNSNNYETKVWIYNEWKVWLFNYEKCKAEFEWKNLIQPYYLSGETIDITKNNPWWQPTWPMLGFNLLTPPLDTKARIKDNELLQETDFENAWIKTAKKYNIYWFRRPLWTKPKNLKYERNEKNDLLLSFSLPTGSYATIFLWTVLEWIDDKTIIENWLEIPLIK